MRCGFKVDISQNIHTPTRARWIPHHVLWTERPAGPKHQKTQRRRGYGRPVRQLIPHHVEEVEPLETYPFATRTAPPQRPWVMLNMIASIDGATSIEGISGGLGGPGDKAVFGAIRASCDWILVAAGTARAERYGLPRPGEAARAARIAAGRSAVPRLAVVSGSLDLDLDLPMLADRRDQEQPVVVITGDTASAERVRELSGHAEVLTLEGAKPTPEATLAALHHLGATVVLVEGGPRYNAQFAVAGLIDEICVSISPKVAGGDSLRMVAGGPPLGDLDFVLDQLLEHDSMLFARYLRA